jgi:hypothetical protein
MIKDALIGTLTGVVAVVAVAFVSPAPKEAPVIREMMETYNAPFDDRGLGLTATTRPDPAAQKLEKILEKVEVQRGRLDRLLTFIATSTGANLTVDWRAMEAAGIESGVAVTMNLQHVSAKAVLKEALTQAGGGNVRISYRIADNIIHISTVDALYHDVITRVYDVRDLIDDTLKNWKTQRKKGNYQEASDALIRLIQETIDPTIWRDAGGSAGGMREIAGKLVVTLPVEKHQELVELLIGLQRTQKKTP